MKLPDVYFVDTAQKLLYPMHQATFKYMERYAIDLVMLKHPDCNGMPIRWDSPSDENPVNMRTECWAWKDGTKYRCICYAQYQLAFTNDTQDPKLYSINMSIKLWPSTPM